MFIAYPLSTGHLSLFSVQSDSLLRLFNWVEQCIDDVVADRRKKHETLTLLRKGFETSPYMLSV
jgi:hypothetical protein